MPLHEDTIFALSSARGRAGIAVVRVSGTGAATAVRLLAGPELPVPRMAARRRIKSARGEPIDDGLLLWFSAPASFTGEDVAEFHIHGGRAGVDALLAALEEISGLRPAEPGEFTRRAVENGKFDLTQAEALADVINAETGSQHRQALRQYDGALTELYGEWRERLVHAGAWIEAVIDFSEDEIPTDALARSKRQITEIAAEIRSHLNDSRRGEILREGFHLTVIGPPNSGKSSLVNALTRREAAIVSEIAGTTRDVLEVHLDLGGYPVIVADTAGLRETGDKIEAEGVRRALLRSEAANAVLLLLDATCPEAVFPALPRSPDLTAWNKTDLAPAPNGETSISVRQGTGMDELLEQIGSIVSSRLDSSGPPALTRQRYRHALTHANEALQASLGCSEPEIIAENLRIALRELGRITGRIDVEDLLEVVFRDFCIGK